MSSDPGGTDAYAPPPPHGYGYAGPAGYPSPQGYGPTFGYPPPGYGPPFGHPGYGPPGFGHPGYPPFGPPPAFKPGIIPLRPLTLSEIFNGSITYVRKNPKAVLGLTTAVVVIGQILALLLQIGPLATSGVLSPGGMTGTGADEISDSTAIGLILSSFASIITTVLAAIVLSGLLTVVVGRAVFGAPIGIGEAWQRARGRLLPLLAITAIEAAGAIVLIGLAVGITVFVDVIASDAAAFVVGAALALSVTALLVYLYTMLLFAPTLIVLERLKVTAAIARSFALVKSGFWRVLGIQLLAVVVTGLISGALSAPFSVIGQIALLVGESAATTVVAVVLISVGGIIGQIITSPFSAGVVVLLYADRRIRAEAFDLVLQTGAMGPVDSTDDLWLSPHR